MVKSDKKNILFIFADQMHKFALGCMGTDDILTPNLDKLANDGVLFKNAYSNCPICSPFRVNLFSGMYAAQTGAYNNEAIVPDNCVSLADEFNRNDYLTSYIGKWHIGATGNRPIPENLRAGFTDFIGYQCYNGFNDNVSFYDEQNIEHKYDSHRTDVTTDIAIERLNKIDDSPFAMFVSYQSPHYPEQPSPEFEKLYKNKTIKLRKNCINIDPYTKTASPPTPENLEQCADYVKYGNNLNEYLKLYYAMVTQVDDGIGRIIETLEKLGKRENTVIVFTSDHGDMQGAHGLKNKCQPYEESAGIPLIINDPDGLKGSVREDLVSCIDLYPTCLELAGISTEEKLPGNNLTPLIYNKNESINKPVFSEFRKWLMVRVGNYKMVFNKELNKKTMLFDLEKDPYEMENLINNPDYKNIYTQLENNILYFQKTFEQ